MRGTNTGHFGISFMAARPHDSHAPRFLVFIRGHKRSFSCTKFGVVAAAYNALTAAGLMRRKYVFNERGELVSAKSQKLVKTDIRRAAISLAYLVRSKV